MTKLLWRNIEMITTPGQWTVNSTGKTVPSSFSVNTILDICEKIKEAGKGSSVPVCIDYMPISVFHSGSKNVDTRTLYCSLVRAESPQGLPKVCFRMRPHTSKLKDGEVLLNTVLIEHIFNCSAINKLIEVSNSIHSIQESIEAISAGKAILTEIEKTASIFKDKQLSNFTTDTGISGFTQEILTPLQNTLNTALSTLASSSASANPNSVAEATKKILKNLSLIVTAVRTMSDSILSLALYVYEAEATAVAALPYLKQIQQNSDFEAVITKHIMECNKVTLISEIPVLNINTVNMWVLQLLSNHSLAEIRDRVATDAQAKLILSDLLGEYLDSQQTSDADLKAMYDRHLFMANYELMYLERNSYSNHSQNLVAELEEYVPIARKFPGVPNPIFDTHSGTTPWFTLLQSGSQGVFASAVYQYATSAAGQFETFDHMIQTGVDDDDELYELRSILLPCSVFDSFVEETLADRFFITPENVMVRFGEVNKDNLFAFSPYLAAIFMCSLLCYVAKETHSIQVFTVNDQMKFAGQADIGCYSFDVSPDKTRTMPKSVSFGSIFGFCGKHKPLNEGEHTQTLSLYDTFLYKAIIASKKMPVGVESIKKKLSFDRWLNLKPGQTINI